MIAGAPLANDACRQCAIGRPVHHHREPIAEITDSTAVGIVVPAYGAQHVGRAFEREVDVAAAQAQQLAEGRVDASERGAQTLGSGARRFAH